MAQKDTMDTLVTSKPSGDGGQPKTGKGSASTSAHKALISRNLKLVYGEVAGEKVPDRFLELLGKLGDAEEKSS